MMDLKFQDFTAHASVLGKERKVTLSALMAFEESGEVSAEPVDYELIIGGVTPEEAFEALKILGGKATKAKRRKRSAKPETTPAPVVETVPEPVVETAPEPVVAAVLEDTPLPGEDKLPVDTSFDTVELDKQIAAEDAAKEAGEELPEEIRTARRVKHVALHFLELGMTPEEVIVAARPHLTTIPALARAGNPEERLLRTAQTYYKKPAA